MRFTPHIPRRAPALLFLFALSGVPLAASAQEVECATDDDCGHGYVCETGSFTACPEIACADDSECEQPVCEPTEYASCVLAPCEADADCPDGLTCASNEYERCDYPDLDCRDDGTPCDEKPEPTHCETVVDRYCAAPWELPCSTSDDCGEGFDCVETESCGCSGSAGSAGDGEPEPEPTSSCSCEPSGEFWCEQQEIECAGDGDCPSDWSCQDNPFRPVCSAPSGSGDAEMVSCGGEDLPEKTCQPPSYDRGGFGFAVLEADAATTGGVAASSGPPVLGDGAEGVPRGDADDNGAGASSSGGDSGCSVSGQAGDGGAFGWLALPLLFVAARRRHGARAILN